MASRALREQLYPEGHPYRIPVSGEIDSVSSLTSENLANYHRRSFGPNVTTIALVGGVANLDAVVAQVERVFGSWTAPVPDAREVPAVDPPVSTVRKSYVIRGKSQADIAIGYPSLPRSLDKPYFAVNLANVILGQLGLMGRLGANVRDKQGLAYYASSSFGGGTANSVWTARAGVDPGNIQRALDGILDELRRIRNEHVTAEELADARSYLIGSLPLALESLGGVAGLLLAIEKYGLGLDYLERYPGYIAELTQDDLLSAAQTYLDPDRLVIGIAGPESIEAVEKTDA
jgi:zinc protease